jgi:hypothetical protein
MESVPGSSIFGPEDDATGFEVESLDESDVLWLLAYLEQ